MTHLRLGCSPAARPAPASPGQRCHPRPARAGRGQHGGVVHDSAAPRCSATKSSCPAQGQPADRPRPATGSHGHVPRCYQVIVSPTVRAYRIEQEVLLVICVKRNQLSSCRPGPRRRLARSRVAVAVAYGCTSRPSPLRTPCRERGSSVPAPPVTERTSRPAPPSGISAVHTRLRCPSARRTAEPRALAAGRRLAEAPGVRPAATARTARSQRLADRGGPCTPRTCIAHDAGAPPPPSPRIDREERP